MCTHAWRRSFGLLLPLALLLGIFCMPASASGSRHPYFNDRGTLPWFHSFRSAQRAARQQNKVIFIEYGRKKCGNCKKLAQNVLPHRFIRGRMQGAAVGLAAECDRPERAVYDLFKTHLPGARTLPFAAFVTPDGQWITGWYGGRSVETVSAHLSMAESHVRAMRAPVRRRSPERIARRPAPPMRTAPVEQPTEPRRRVYPAPPPPEEESDRDCESDNDCADGSACVGGNCKPPSFDCKPALELPCLPNPLKLLAGNCKPKACPPKPVCPPEPALPPTAEPAPTPLPPPAPATVTEKTNGYGDFPPPATRIEGPKRLLADTASGSPDGPPDREAPALRAAPVIADAAPTKAARLAPAPRSVPTNKPVADAEDRAKEAAARGDWGSVLRLTRGATEDQRYLRALNREAHAWAHSRLAYAVLATRRGRFVEARQAVEKVQAAMRGEAEAVDAERGAEAIEFMRDIEPLAEKSAVRTTVRKTAYEKMRGTRWAPLFSPCPQPSAALSSR